MKVNNQICRATATAVALLLTSFSTAYADKLSDMISPVSNPVNFEDPRINSEIRPLYAHHVIDDDFVTKGGDVNIVAIQARFAVTEDLAIIATKDGYVDLNPDAVVPEDDGFANIAAGVKYALYSNVDSGEILTAGLRFEFPVGDEEVLQGEGDGIFNPFLSGALSLGDWNLMGYLGGRLPIDGADSTFVDVSTHLDYKLGSFYPLVELNYFYVADGGRRLPIADEGQDFFNLGATEAGGESLLTLAAGARYKFTDSVVVGAAYEIPLNNGAGTRIIDWRVTTDLIVSF